MKELPQDQWKQQMAEDDNAFLLDVRTNEEVEEGQIPNAKQLDIYQPQAFMEGVESFDKSKNYYVYCRSGKRSAQACMLLDQAGVANTYNLEGGFMEWNGDVEKA